ncbi:hypothetical protein HYALB_00006107 [Hymenoscyphus albidus]|uniref:Uncharacterized protein n=1 Tax=Hymenoscyphus albidus TaxID=595503 RepID=A0A9N9M2T4_9HELO|nr:hypothetical protein HYALB_00006107 [Hymenoscyphus albidus]
MIISAFFCLLALATFSTALPLDQSRPFALVILSKDKTYNNTTLIPCAKGKGGPFTTDILTVPGLCPLAPFGYPIAPVESFNLNYTSSPTLGYLTHEITNKRTSSGLANRSAPMAFYSADSYKVPIFGTAGLDGATKVVFNEKNFLGVLGDSRSGDGKFEQWYVCDINTGIVYPSVVWSSGDKAPQLASCVKVDVMRAFA